MWLLLPCRLRPPQAATRSGLHAHAPLALLERLVLCQRQHLRNSCGWVGSSEGWSAIERPPARLLVGLEVSGRDGLGPLPLLRLIPGAVLCVCVIRHQAPVALARAMLALRLVPGTEGGVGHRGGRAAPPLTPPLARPPHRPLPRTRALTSPCAPAAPPPSGWRPRGGASSCLSCCASVSERDVDHLLAHAAPPLVPAPATPPPGPGDHRAASCDTRAVRGAGLAPSALSIAALLSKACCSMCGLGRGCAWGVSGM